MRRAATRARRNPLSPSTEADREREADPAWREARPAASSAPDARRTVHGYFATPPDTPPSSDVTGASGFAAAPAPARYTAQRAGHRTGRCRPERRQHAAERASPPSTAHRRPVRAGRPPGSRGPHVPNRAAEQSALSMPLPRTNRPLARQASLHAFARGLSRRSSGVFRSHEPCGFRYIRATNVGMLRNADCAACRFRVTPPAIHSTSRGRAAVSPSGKPLP